MTNAGSGRFGAVVTAMITPFDEHGKLDLEGALRLARHLADAGSDALVVAGTTGEGPVLSDGEKIELWEALAESLTIPLIAGAGTFDTAHSVELVRSATTAGVDAILAVTPYYNRPPQAGLRSHFEALAAATELPVMLYDIPVRTGRKIAHDTLVQLAIGTPNIVALKDAAGDPAATARLAAEVPRDFEIYSGDDVLTLPMLSVGALGLVSVASHWAGGELGEMIRSFGDGDVVRAQQINRALLDSYSFETGDEAPNPLPAKAMLRVLGLPAGECRLPLGPAPDGLEERAKRVLADLEAWRDADDRSAAG